MPPSAAQARTSGTGSRPRSQRRFRAFAGQSVCLVAAFQVIRIFAVAEPVYAGKRAPDRIAFPAQAPDKRSNRARQRNRLHIRSSVFVLPVLYHRRARPSTANEEGGPAPAGAGPPSF